jgi:disulfide bond formation protein DsbB
MAVVLPVLSAFGIMHMVHDSVEKYIIFGTLFIVTLVLVYGMKSHKNIYVFIPFTIGLLLLGVGHAIGEVHFLHHLFNIAGAAALILAHQYNMEAHKKCKEDHCHHRKRLGGRV